MGQPTFNAEKIEGEPRKEAKEVSKQKTERQAREKKKKSSAQAHIQRRGVDRT